jgi:hypothetical protein
MPTQIGYVDSNGHPRMTISVRGTHPTEFADLDAFIDTGFAGFLMLPVALALPLGLALYGTGDYYLADGSPISCFLAEGTVEIRPPSELPAFTSPATALVTNPASATQTERVSGVVVIGGDDPLLGMEFIRVLKKWLLIGSTVALVDSEDLPSLQPHWR